jgi:hypothetical protein
MLSQRAAAIAAMQLTQVQPLLELLPLQTTDALAHRAMITTAVL